MTSGTADCQIPLSMGFSRQECCSGLPLSSPRDLPNSGIESAPISSIGRWILYHLNHNLSSTKVGFTSLLLQKSMKIQETILLTQSTGGILSITQDFCGKATLFWMLPAAAAAAKSLQSCPTLCDPIHISLPGSSVPGILQARVLEWVAISFSREVLNPL